MGVTGYNWYNGTMTDTGAIATAIGTGSANTTTIVNNQGAGSYAAQLCDDLTIIGSYSDWFLPSQDELNKMYVNLQSGTDENAVTYTPVGDFDSTGVRYWSSSEDSQSYALAQFFSNGSQGISFKSNPDRVRAVRAF